MKIHRVHQADRGRGSRVRPESKSKMEVKNPAKKGLEMYTMGIEGKARNPVSRQVTEAGA